MTDDGTDDPPQPEPGHQPRVFSVGLNADTQPSASLKPGAMRGPPTWQFFCWVLTGLAAISGVIGAIFQMAASFAFGGLVVGMFLVSTPIGRRLLVDLRALLLGLKD